MLRIWLAGSSRPDAALSDLFFLWVPPCTVVSTKYARAALAGSFVKRWNSKMAAPSWTTFELHAVFRMCKEVVIDIESDGLNVADFICTSIRTAHFAMFPRKAVLFLLLLHQTIVFVIEGYIEMHIHRPDHLHFSCSFNL